MPPQSSSERILVPSNSLPSAPPLDQLTIPAWWQSGRERFEALHDMRMSIYRHERAAIRKAMYVMGTSLLAGASLYSVDAISAVGSSSVPGFLAFFVALMLPLIFAWLLDRHLVQQVREIDRRSQLWLKLVAAVKQGHIDVQQLEHVSHGETKVEQFLRKEAALAARFLASKRTLAPHLPIFGNCFTLESN